MKKKQHEKTQSTAAGSTPTSSTQATTATAPNPAVPAATLTAAAVSAAPADPAPVGIGKLGIRAPLRCGPDDAGHEAVFTLIFGRRHAFVCRVLVAVGVQERHVEDVAVEVFMRLHRWMQKEHVPRHERALLKRMAVRETLSYVRRGSTDVETVPQEAAYDVPDGGRSPERELRDAERESLVEKELREMDAEDRELIRRIDYEDEPYAAVAESLGRTPQAIHTKLRRARGELADRVRSHLSDDDLGWDR